MDLALYQPDIPPNTGTIIRMAACLEVRIHIIEPCGFPFGEKSFRRPGMDYIDQSKISHHNSWKDFLIWAESRRIVLLSTKAAENYTDFVFKDDDIILLGQESAGVPDNVHNRAHTRLLIPMAPTTRSLNIAISAAIVLGEALRQTNGFPK